MFFFVSAHVLVVKHSRCDKISCDVYFYDIKCVSRVHILYLVLTKCAK